MRSTGTSGSTEPDREGRPKHVGFEEHRTGRATRESCTELRREAAYDADRAPIRQGSPATFAKMRREIVGEAVGDAVRGVEDASALRLLPEPRNGRGAAGPTRNRLELALSLGRASGTTRAYEEAMPLMTRRDGGHGEEPRADAAGRGARSGARRRFCRDRRRSAARRGRRGPTCERADNQVAPAKR